MFFYFSWNFLFVIRFFFSSSIYRQFFFLFIFLSPSICFYFCTLAAVAAICTMDTYTNTRTNLQLHYVYCCRCFCPCFHHSITRVFFYSFFFFIVFKWKTHTNSNSLLNDNNHLKEWIHWIFVFVFLLLFFGPFFKMLTIFTFIHFNYFAHTHNWKEKKRVICVLFLFRLFNKNFSPFWNHNYTHKKIDKFYEI